MKFPPEHQFDPDGLAVLSIQLVRLALRLGHEATTRPEFADWINHPRIRGILIAEHGHRQHEDWDYAYMGKGAPDERTKEVFLADVNDYRKKYIKK